MPYQITYIKATTHVVPWKKIIHIVVCWWNEDMLEYEMRYDFPCGHDNVLYELALFLWLPRLYNI